MKKISFILALCIIFSFGFNVIASAEEYKVTPRFNNASIVECTFDILNDVAYVNVRVSGYSGITSKITVKATLEKRALFGLWWTDVDEWTQSTNNANKTFEFTKSVGGGTYRCTFEVTVEGSGGSADVYTKELTAKN